MQDELAAARQAHNETALADLAAQNAILQAQNTLLQLRLDADAQCPAGEAAVCVREVTSCEADETAEPTVTIAPTVTAAPTFEDEIFLKATIFYTSLAFPVPEEQLNVLEAQGGALLFFGAASG